MIGERNSLPALEDDAQSHTDMAKRLLKGEDVAGILQVSKSFAYQLIRCGDIPSVRLGRAVRVRPEDLDAFVKASINRQDTLDLRRVAK